MLLFLLLIGREKKMGGSCLNRVFPWNTQHDDKGKFNNSSLHCRLKVSTVFCLTDV